MPPEDHEETPVDQSGRPLGPRALQTRRRLLEATEALLSEKSLRDLAVVDIARRAGTSPATFYQYFKDVPEVTLCLAEQASREIPAFAHLVDGSWEGAEGLERARSIVEAFLEHWDAHRRILLIRNHAADDGDDRFRVVRRNAHVPMLQRLAAQIEVAQREGRVDAALHPLVAAAAADAMLERLAAYHTVLEPIGMSRSDLVETCARILLQCLTGRSG